MYTKIIYVVVLFTLYHCQSDKNSNQMDSQFEINGTVTHNQGFENVYLSYVSADEIILIDSSQIKGQSFQLKGPIHFPKKAYIQFYPQGNSFPFILSGEKIEIQLNAQDLNASTVQNSTINKEWNALKQKSVEIYGDVDYLFPLMHKARIQNDYQTLTQINSKIDSIETLNRQYLLGYITQHLDNPLSVLILNDLYHNLQNDSVQIIQTSQKMSPELKKALDFEIK
jgi:hypothetical protein